MLYYQNAISLLKYGHFSTDYLSIKYYGFVFYNVISLFPLQDFQFSILFIYINNLLIFLLIFSYLLLYFQTREMSSHPKVLWLLYPLTFAAYNYFIMFNLRDIIILSILITALLVYKRQMKNHRAYALLILSTLIFFRFELLFVIAFAIAIAMIVDKYFAKHNLYAVALTSILIFSIPITGSFPLKDFMGGKVLETIYLPDSGFYNYDEKINFIAQASEEEIGKTLTKTYFKQLPSVFLSYNPYRYFEQWIYSPAIQLLNTQHLFRVLISFFLILILYPYLLGILLNSANKCAPRSFNIVLASFILYTGIYILKFNLPDFRIILIFLPLLMIELIEWKNKVKYKHFLFLSFSFLVFSIFFEHLKELYFNMANL